MTDNADPVHLAIGAGNGVQYMQAVRQAVQQFEDHPVFLLTQETGQFLNKSFTVKVVFLTVKCLVNGDGVCLSGTQSPAERVGTEMKLFDRTPDFFLHLRADVSQMVDDPGNRGAGNPRQSCHIFDGCLLFCGTRLILHIRYFEYFSKT